MKTPDEPVLNTAPQLLGIRGELLRREPIFHRPELGAARADFENMVAADFCEVGASGRRYSRTYVLDELVKRRTAPHADVWEAKDFHCRQLGHNFYLTYILMQDGTRTTRRSTIWERTTVGWKIVYHRGTVVE
jgi:hypothetical protein